MNDMRAIKLFATILERHLPPLESVHTSARDAGFCAWDIFINERLRLVPESIRDVEAKVLLLSCREEFCNFSCYTRNSGGDGIEIAELATLRRQARSTSKTGVSFLLKSDALMYEDKSVAVKYANVTKQRASAVFALERERYVDSLISMIDGSPSNSFQGYVAELLRRHFAGAGFLPHPSLGGAACFEKLLTQSATVLACVEDVDRLGTAGWSGEVRLLFYVRPGGGIENAYVRTCCTGLAGLPLRLAGLAPGLETYTSGGYLLPSKFEMTAFGDTITLSTYETAAASPQVHARALSQVMLAIDCYLAFFAAIEIALVLACEEFQQESRSSG